MNMSFVPCPAVAFSLLAVGLLPVYVLGLSHGPGKVRPPGRRFMIAAGLTGITWAGLMVVPAAPDPADVVAGGLLVLTALLAGFTLWTLVAWGFTLSLLLTLARADRPQTLDQWVVGYTGGRPLTAFSQDRLGVLFRLGLAEERGGRVVMTPGRGRRFARVVGLLRRVFGLPT